MVSLRFQVTNLSWWIPNRRMVSILILLAEAVILRMVSLLLAKTVILRQGRMKHMRKGKELINLEQKIPFLSNQPPFTSFQSNQPPFTSLLKPCP